MSSGVFISWSKDRSRKMAQAFKALIGSVMELRVECDGDPDWELAQHDIARLSEDLPKGGSAGCIACLAQAVAHLHPGRTMAGFDRRQRGLN